MLLVVPPDQTRFHSRAGDLTHYAWEYYGDSPPSGAARARHAFRHVARSSSRACSATVPQSLFRVHNWRTDVETLGEVPAEFIQEQSEGKLNYAWPAQVNRLIVAWWLRSRALHRTGRAA